MKSSVPRLMTVGEIAKRLNQPVHRIEYLIQARRIRPRAMAGNARCFDDAAVAELRRHINTLDARQMRAPASEGGSDD